ncbi:hypothetical protein HPO96_05270 [Kribbella sandramycini]|uniref:Catechol 2,3-dioxygenase-like lactoylglutathione lyase family enzyme n=1 Tax=Kribbella sandramycini TaxID=60450 RepID=A0A7Y4NXN5_9ACTN|nr:VOC family protein [Kribbella sandramycini]MBB6567753.1 catechol 2,3-dioxygenase-like lactoylglutathione lyase family enzyme [Kribbella sandramycini]NOL39651.1 hypothetical protein [Kribbella sandramycini]
MTLSISQDHIGIVLLEDDLEPTIAWYTEVFGFEVVRRTEGFGQIYVFLANNDIRIELLTGATTRQPKSDDVFTTLDPSRYHHLCFAVDDLDAAVAHLADHGVPLTGGPFDITELNRRNAFISDNLGNVIELIAPA